MQKILSFFAIVLITSSLLAQNNWLSPDPELSNFEKPKQTTITLNFPEEISDTLEAKLLHLKFSMMPERMDTTLPFGTYKLTASLSLDHAHLLRITINDVHDKLFVIPGTDLEVVYEKIEPGKIIKSIADNETLQNINAYYNEFYKSLGYPADIRKVYSQFGMLPTLQAVADKFLELAKQQKIRLHKHSPWLPEWFLAYEERNITYTALGYIFNAASYRKRILQIEEEISDGFYEQFDTININDEKAISTEFYYQFLNALALRQFCSEACYGGSQEARNQLQEAMLNFAKTIENQAVRDYFLAVNVYLTYQGNQRFPAAIEESFLSAISEKQYKTRLAEVKANIENLIGKTTPTFYLKNITGDLYSIQDFRGKIVLLNFWFTACKPCIEEIPYERELELMLADEDFLLINICTNSTEAQWRETVNKYKMPGLNLFAKGNWSQKLVESYQIKGYPTYVLVGKDGKIIDDKCEKPRSKQLVQLIEKHL